MGKRSRSRYTPSRRQETLAQPVNVHGTGEDPAVRALLSKEFVGMSDLDALQVALRIQQIVEGQNSVLDQLAQGMSSAADAINRLNERMDRYDRAAAAFDENEDKFVEGVLNDAERRKLPESQAANLRAKAAANYGSELGVARISLAAERARFDELLARQPKVSITSPGRARVVRSGEVITTVLEPEVIMIKHRKFVLPPGIPTEVPMSVAETYYQRQTLLRETDERKAALSLDGGMKERHENSQVARRWQEINRKYGTSSEGLPTG